MHPSCKQSPRSEEPGRQCLETDGLCECKIEEEIYYTRDKKRRARETTGSFTRESKKLSVKALAWINWCLLYLFPDMEKQSLHPADDWLICTGGLSVAKTGYGVVKIRNSRDQNCQHGFQRFIFSMLSAACYSLTFFLSCQKSILQYTSLLCHQHVLSTRTQTH